MNTTVIHKKRRKIFMFEEEFKKDRARRERVDAGNKLCNMQYDSFSLPVKSSIRSV